MVAIYSRSAVQILLIVSLCAIPVAGCDACTFVFAAIGDYGDNSNAQRKVANLVNDWDADFIITTGDNRYGTNNFDKVVGQFYCGFLTDAVSGIYCNGGNSPTNAFFPSPGNHDYSDGADLNEYLQYFTLPGTGVASSNTSGSERYYDFVQGPVHLFAIDSQGALDSVSDMASQQTWLQRQLGASTAYWQVVYLHHAPYSSSKHGSYPELQWPFADWGADALIAGHDHVYERLVVDGIPYFINGLGGRSIYSFNMPLVNSQFRYNTDYGAMRITADTRKMTFEFVNTSSVVLDSYTLKKDNYLIDRNVYSANDDFEKPCLP